MTTRQYCKKQQQAKKAKIAPRITQQLPCLSWFIYSSSSLSRKYVVVMILHTQSCSSSEKGYIADTRTRILTQTFLPRLPTKPILMTYSNIENPIYNDPEKTKLLVLVELSRPAS